MVTLNAPSIRSNEASEKQLDELHIPVDLISVVDQSGSMQGKRIALLKETLNYIVDRMGPLDRLAIVSFDTTAKETLQNAIWYHIQTGGDKSMDSGLEMAIKLLRNRQATNPLGALLVLTDGQDSQRHDYSNLMEQLPEDVVCHTFGYGSDHYAALLSQIV
ncbi:unnamed protein product [Rotaria socialis]|uniref:VWFA domain-containing protein n=1 Tax=Rotaria socialis TaxID=392032 RepID=A0A821F9J6_9BILA|nr:unnamed protein product [Rotaria socialis]CAF4646119.1 unnamed protein product [Rotaria socialis]